MNSRNMNIILIILVFIIAVVPLALYEGLGEDEGYFGGADGEASEVIEDTGYEPWAEPLWEPPSGEIESLLFAVQAAIGAIIIGYFIGYWRGQKSKEK